MSDMEAEIQDRPKAKFAPRRLAHANVFVSDLERSLTFYSAVCGLSEVFREPGIKAIFMSNGSSHHDLAIMGIDDKPRLGRDGHLQIPSGRGTKAGLNHLGWEMESEKLLVEAYRRAKAAGVDINRTTDHGMSHSVYLFDPEGTFLEFYADATADWKAFYAAKENQLISGNWDPLAAEPSAEPLYNADFQPEFVAGAPVHPRQIARVTLIVDDFPGMLLFYQEVAGLVPLHRDDTVGIAVLAGSTGEPAVALFAAAPGERAGLHHLGFELVDRIEMDRLMADLGRIGATPVETLERADRSGVVLLSPDGLLLEFYLLKSGGPPGPGAGRDLYLI